METDNKQFDIVERWEQLYLQERRSNTDGNAAKADVLRSQMALTELARAKHMYVTSIIARAKTHGVQSRSACNLAP